MMNKLKNSPVSGSSRDKVMDVPSFAAVGSMKTIVASKSKSVLDCKQFSQHCHQDGRNTTGCIIA
jgi:hypothetical protein